MSVDFELIYNEIIDRLKKHLPRHLKYHSVKHTIYVVDVVEYIAHKEGIPKDDIKLLKVAALYHDMGFLLSPDKHEKRSRKMAREELPKYGFNEEEIEVIGGMIMATKIPQKIYTPLEGILADADLEYLATSNFETVSNFLFIELKHFNPDLSENEWFEIQRKFIENHQFHSNYCKKYKEHRKRKNLERLIADNQLLVN